MTSWLRPTRDRRPRFVLDLQVDTKVYGGGDDDFVGSPVTKEMEFIPLVKPSEIKQGVAVKFRLVRDGKPMKTAQVFGSYAGFAKDSENTGAFMPEQI